MDIDILGQKLFFYFAKYALHKNIPNNCNRTKDIHHLVKQQMLIWRVISGKIDKLHIIFVEFKITPKRLM
jgi:hypothetical protein